MKNPLLTGLKNVKPYPLVTGDALYSVRPPAMQIDQFLTVGGIMGMTSYPGVGKSWLALEAARSVASGSPFLGQFRTTRGGVLFVGSDSSIEDYARQWTRLTRHVEESVDLFEPVRFLVSSPFMFENIDEVRRLIRTHQTFEWGETTQGPDGPVREAGFHLIIFDTLSKLTRANQNDNSQMEEVFRNIRLVADATNAALIILHHNSKKSEFNDGSDWRGASGQIGALDSWVHLAPSRRDKYLIGIQFKKFRGITPPDFSYRMAVMDPETASLVISDEPVTGEQELRNNPLTIDIIATLNETANLRPNEIRNRLWDRYNTGVEHGESILKFDSSTLFLRAINNRLGALLRDGRLTRDLNGLGKAVYRVRENAKAQGSEVPEGDQVPTQEERGSDSTPQQAEAQASLRLHDETTHGRTPVRVLSRKRGKRVKK